MNDRFHVGTFLFGALLILVGAVLTGVGFGWWELAAMNLRYVGPVFVTLVGVLTLVGALNRGSHGGPERGPQN